MVIGQDITVVGGGIGGVAAGAALAMRGASVRVLEQAPALTEVGAGLQISPNGMRVLHALGVDVAGGMPAGSVELRDGLTGRLVLHQDLGGQDYRLWHRADLLGALVSRARELGVAIETGRRVQSVRQVHSWIELTDAEGVREDAAVLIAADGIHSVLRAALNPDEGDPFFTRQVAWRAVIPGDGISHPAGARIWMGPGRHLVSYPLRGGTMINLVGIQERRDWTGESWIRQGDPIAMRQAFDAFVRAREMLGRVETVNQWGLHRHPVAPIWSLPRAAILGDAAHPTLPFMAQGANMALEDAWVLADCLARNTPEIGLSEYAALRRPRVNRIVGVANRNAQIYHQRGPLRGLQLGVMSLGGKLFPRIPQAHYRWIFDHDVTA
ncbi:FAD-dependent monooxygenase [Aliiroseovarius sp. PTFE2010]|uniref:FAD-dependent monooxygenase n=1 Tax=Aliiroseovarius sp. PTFE2010 TaxID=3417190 RepID=UPI003CF8FD24